ncbi:MAG: DsbA family protein [Solirubrobacteraceae bacterium]
MGELIILADRFEERSGVLNDRFGERSRVLTGERPAFFFDLGCPFSYLAAERVERLLGEADWIPTASAALGPRGSRSQRAAARAQAQRRAAALDLPLVWPDRSPPHVPGALRAAAHAARSGGGARFALAASRLAFCGGFDLDDPEIIAEAAAAAGIPLAGCLAAARDPDRDVALQASARVLLEHGISGLPAVRLGRRWFQGEGGLAQAATARRMYATYGRPLAPAG